MGPDRSHTDRPSLSGPSDVGEGVAIVVEEVERDGPQTDLVPDARPRHRCDSFEADFLAAGVGHDPQQRLSLIHI